MNLSELTYTLPEISVQIRSFSGPYFPALGLNTERLSVSLRIQSEWGKYGAEKTPYLGTFHVVLIRLNSTNIRSEIWRQSQVLKFHMNSSPSFKIHKDSCSFKGGMLEIRN